KYKEGVGRVIVEPDAPKVLTFETAFYIHKPASGDVHKFLESEAKPLIAIPIGANPNGNLPMSGKIINLDGNGFSLLTFKKAEVDDGYVIRLMETMGRKSKVIVSPGLFAVKSAELLDIVEKPIKSLPVRNGALTIEMHPREIVTVRLHILRTAQ
ncbi:MAG: glycosyl hydrolase-related protein, partial [Armatimonadota bacterium]|nr:glycosyl hydrolase-related protein [Armatimonadota bacterium]